MAAAPQVLPRLIRIDHLSPTEAVRQVLEQLADIGVTQLSVELEGRDYVVVNLARPAPAPPALPKAPPPPEEHCSECDEMGHDCTTCPERTKKEERYRLAAELRRKENERRWSLDPLSTGPQLKEEDQYHHHLMSQARAAFEEKRYADAIVLVKEAIAAGAGKKGWRLFHDLRLLIADEEAEPTDPMLSRCPACHLLEPHECVVEAQAPASPKEHAHLSNGTTSTSTTWYTRGAWDCLRFIDSHLGDSEITEGAYPERTSSWGFRDDLERLWSRREFEWQDPMGRPPCACSQCCRFDETSLSKHPWHIRPGSASRERESRRARWSSDRDTLLDYLRNMNDRETRSKAPPLKRKRAHYGYITKIGRDEGD